MKLKPRRLDTFINTEQQGVEKYLIEYDGWHFEGATKKSVVNKVLKYIFTNGRDD